MADKPIWQLSGQSGSPLGSVLEIAGRAGLGWILGKVLQHLTGWESAPLIGAGLGAFWPVVYPSMKPHFQSLTERITTTTSG